MRTFVFAGRTTKEILRDPVNLTFGIGFPIILLLLLTAIQRNVHADLFELEQLTPGIAVFGLSFMSLFSATLIAKDRGSSFLDRLFTTPMSASDFILGYTLPLIPMCLIQSLLCYIVAFALGLKATTSIIAAMLLLIPVSFVFIGFGLMCGSIFNDKQVGAICGALLTNLTAWLSGTWFSLDLVGGAFKTIAYCLPFAHAVDMGKAAVAGNYEDLFPHIWWVAGYALVAVLAAVLVFRGKMKAE